MQAAPSSLRVWQVDLGNRSDLVFMLRDFLQRNGMTVEVNGPAALALTTGVRRSEVAGYLAQWEAVTAVPAVLTGEPRALPDAYDFAAVARPRLGELLVRRRFITDEQLSVALNESRETGELLGVVLLNKQLIFEDELARTLSEQLSIPYISVGRVGVDQGASGLMPPEEGYRVAAIPLRFDGAEVQVAFADPTDREALETVRRYIDCMRVVVSELSDIRMAWRQTRQFAAAHLGT